MSYVRSNRDNTISNNLPNNQKMSKADELILKNILSYNQNGKKVREQNEIQRKRAENRNRLIEIQREEVKVINNSMTGQGSWKSEDGNILNDRYNNYNWDISKRDGQDNKSNEYNDFIDKVKTDLKGIKSKEELNEKLEKYKDFSLDFGDFNDLKMAFGSVTGNLEGDIDNNGNIVLKVKIFDDYDFHFTNENGERFDVVNDEGFMREQATWLMKQLNEAGFYYQENGRGKPYKWEMNINEIIK